jgi:hypothetical protein
VRALEHRARCDAVERLEEMLEQDRVAQEMIPGIYLPLDYWDLLAASDDTRGPRGGRVFSYETVRRTINNTLFAALVGRAFVGSRGVTSEAIAEVVACRLRRRSLRDGGRSDQPVAGRRRIRVSRTQCRFARLAQVNASSPSRLRFVRSDSGWQAVCAAAVVELGHSQHHASRTDSQSHSPGMEPHRRLRGFALGTLVAPGGKRARRRPSASNGVRFCSAARPGRTRSYTTAAPRGRRALGRSPTQTRLLHARAITCPACRSSRCDP